MAKVHSRVGLITNSSSEVFHFQRSFDFPSALTRASKDWAALVLAGQFAAACVTDWNDVVTPESSMRAVVSAVAFMNMDYGSLFVSAHKIDRVEPYDERDDWNWGTQRPIDRSEEKPGDRMEVYAGDNAYDLEPYFKDWLRDHYHDYDISYFGRYDG